MVDLALLNAQGSNNKADFLFKLATAEVITLIHAITVINIDYVKLVSPLYISGTII